MNPVENDGHLHFLTPEEVKNSKKSLLLSLSISVIIVGIEIYGAILSNSLALLSDAFHIVMDISAHLISFVALGFSVRKRSLRFTFGLIRSEILAAFINAVLLVFLCGFLIHESLERLWEPQDIEANHMLAFSLVGLFMNSLSAYILFKVSKTSINLRSAYLHALGDLLGTVAVVVGAILIKFTGLHWIDSVFSFFIVAIIARATYYLIKETGSSLLEASPDSHKTDAMVHSIQHVKGIQSILDFKHWSLTAGVECFQCRVLLITKSIWESVIPKIHKILKEDYGITIVNVEPVTKESKALLETIQPNRAKMNVGGHGHHHHGHGHHGHHHHHDHHEIGHKSDHHHHAHNDHKDHRITK